MSTLTTTGNFVYRGDNPWIDALIWGGRWTSNTSSFPVRIDYFYQSGADPYGFNGIASASPWTAAERAALDAVTDAWEAVANIDFRQTTIADLADIWYWLGSDAEVGALGWHEVPDTSAIEPLYGVFSEQGQGWYPAGLLPGGYAFLTILHEVGHGLGLAHPQDNGGTSGIFPGVTSAYDDFGDYDLNQGVFTVMTYNDGWLTEFPNHSPLLGDETYGYSATPMALDIAAIQALYGANTTYANGNDSYALPSANGSGTLWACIWDTGGDDTITATGSDLDYTIDLRPAELTGAHAGGYVSYTGSVVGGFTIANGVEIENAFGGSGDDTITGNDARNTLLGGLGNDSLSGGGANDTLRGGGGNDSLRGGGGDDVLDGGGGGDVIDGGAGRDTVSYESATRSVRVDLQNTQFMYGDAVGDTFISIEVFRTGDTVDQLRGDAGGNVFYTGGLSDRLYGRAGNDTLFGEGGADAFYGGLGADTMTGGSGAGRRDRYIYFNIAESGVGAGKRDIITDFVAGEDRIEISRFDADTTQGFKQAFTFVGSAGLSGTAGELGYRHLGGNTIVQADVDGDGVADFEIQLTGIMTLTENDFLI